MTRQTNKISYLDGIRLYRALIAGIRYVISRQDYLNNINVYPVPDKDTGTNLALTLNSIIEGIYTKDHLSIHKLLDIVADSALDGARGNSGTIFAQFFLGLSEGAKTVNRKLTAKNFVAAITTGSNYAHRALSEPKEGTILTIIRDFSDEITHQQLSNDEEDYVSLLQAGIKRANASLQNTTQQLKALKKANVVDAGAQGFVDFLTGIYEFILTGSIGNLEIDDEALQVDDSPEVKHNLTTEKYRFCTECIIEGEHIDHNELRYQLESLGNCVIVAGSHKKTKIHIHTNEPAVLFDTCRKYGTLKKEKADDMIHQQLSTLNKDQRVAILTDSGADFCEGMVKELNIHVVPLLIHFGNESLIDKISITPTEFYQKMLDSDEAPKTSQPSRGDFKRQYQYLASHYESIIAFHIPDKVSGTFSSSQSAAEANHHTNITVIDSNNVTGAQSLIVSYAARAAKAGYSHAQIVKLAQSLISKTGIYFTIQDLSYGVRGGRISKNKQRFLDLLGLKPILGFDETGKIKVKGVLRGNKNVAKKLATYFCKKINNSIAYHIVLSHANEPEKAEQLQALLEEKLPHIASICIVECAATLGAHTGPGALAISYQEDVPLPEKED